MYRGAEKNSSHYLKVMVINMSNWFVTRIWSMASNKKYSPKFHSEFWNKDGLASLFSCGIPRKNERSSFYPVLQKDIMYITLHTVLKLHVCLKIIFTYFYLNFRAKMEWLFGSEIQINFTWIYGQKKLLDGVFEIIFTFENLTFFFWAVGYLPSSFAEFHLAAQDSKGSISILCSLAVPVIHL